MNRRRACIRIFGASLLVLAITLNVGAQQPKQNRAAGQQLAQAVDVRNLLQGLRLTEAQRDEIKAIIQAHRADILESRKEQLRARLAMVKEDPNGPGYSGAAQTRLMQMRLQIVNEIKSKLTSDQLDLLKEKQQRQADRLQKMLDRLQNIGKN